MSSDHEPGAEVRLAGIDDADAIGRLLHDFNTEFDEPTPSPAALSKRLAGLIGEGQTKVLLGGAGPDAIAVLRLRTSIWSEQLECYLAELYVRPEQRGRGLGRALLQAAIELARQSGADHIDLTSGEQDVAARALYESLGFSNRECKPAGPLQYYFEREL